MVLGRTLALTLSGVIVGACGALALTGLMRNMLFEVSSADPATFGTIALLFTIADTATGYLPARRASQIEPMKALR